MREIVTAKKGPKPRGGDLFTALMKADGVEVVREHRFHPTRRWRFDYACVSAKVALEVEGGVFTNGRHTRAKGFLGDMDKYNEAASMGWLVFRCTPDTLITRATMEMLKDAVASRV